MIYFSLTYWHLSLKPFLLPLAAFSIECHHAVVVSQPISSTTFSLEKTTSASPALSFNPVLHSVGFLVLLLDCSHRWRKRQMRIDDFLHFQPVWRVPFPLGTSGLSLQRVHSTWSKAVKHKCYRWNCSPKKFLVLPFPLTSSGKNPYL